MALKKKAKIIISGAAAVVVVVGIAVGASLGRSTQSAAPATTASADGKKLTVIRTYTRTDCGATPYLVADQKGFFAEEGLKIQYTGTLAYAQQLASIVNGNNDIGDAHPNELAMFIKGGAKVKGVSRDDLEPTKEVDAKYRHMRYYVKKGSPIKSWEDLANYKTGKKILMNGTVPSCTTFIPGAIFDRFKLDRNRLQFVTFDSDQQALQAVGQGSIDIAQVHPPYYHLAQQSELVQIGDSFDSGMGPGSAVALYYFSEKFIAEHPDTVQHFVNAITKAQIWALHHHEEAAALTAKALNTDATGTHYYAYDTAVIESQLQPWIDDLVRGGFLKKDQLKPSDLVTHQFRNPKIFDSTIESKSE
ncbi:MAG: ABC transporter substrate-binding protein [Oscillospiraceae bacterium]|nr:ABC transporter substrate-binding protein [Oscillospiraceae bacterium]